MIQRALVTGGLLLAGLLTAETKADFSFGEPQVLKLDWSTRSLEVADINMDGLQDLAVINNDTAQIELLYQYDREEAPTDIKRSLQRDRWEPVLHDANFISEKVTIGFQMFDLALGDLNADGRADLAYSSRDVPLTIRFQGENGGWTETQEFDGFDALGWQGTLEIRDLNGDEQAEVVLLSGDAARVFSQDGAGRLTEPEVYYLTGETPFNLEIVDVTGDGLSELCYVTTEGKQSLVMREQLAKGGFGAERRFVLERPVRMYLPIPGGRGEPVQFSTVDSRSGALEFLEIDSVKEAHGELPLEGVQPQVYPLFKKLREGARYGFADLNGDGERDLQIANPANSELIVFIKESGRFDASKTFPTFSSISSLAGGRFFGSRSEVIVALSREEKTLGVSRFDSNGRVSFPRLIQVGEGDPLACAAVDLDKDGFDELALVQSGESGMQLIIAQPAERSKLSSEWQVRLQLDLDGVRRKPDAIRSLEVFGQRGPGLMIFVPREAPVLLAPKEDGAAYDLEMVAVHSSIRESLLKEIEPAQISEIDVDGDGFRELVAARTGFARAIRFEGGRLEMVDQFNARRSEDRIGSVVPWVQGEDLEGLVLYIPDEGELQFLLRDEDGVLRYRNADKVGSIGLEGWLKFEGRKAFDDAYVLWGEDRFWYFAPHADSWELNVSDTFETQLEDIYYSFVQAGDFESDGSVDLVAVDGNEHVVELLARAPDQWSSVMYWEVFEQNMHYQGRTGAKLEPREAVVADLNGDGRLDFAFLIHDRIIVYPQE